MKTPNRPDALPLPTIRRYPAYLRAVRARGARGEADWASIGAEHFNNAEGAVNRLVSPASATERQTILWQPLESWAGECNEATRAVVTAWNGVISPWPASAL